ncbi:hypothetical protein IGI52_002437 [Enterococcus sp. DIV0187]
MKETLKAAKQKMKSESRPYNTYGYYVSLPILFITILILSYLGIDIGTTIGSVLFVFTIFAHIEARKLRVVSKKICGSKYTLCFKHNFTTFDSCFILRYPTRRIWGHLLCTFRVNFNSTSTANDYFLFH